MKFFNLISTVSTRSTIPDWNFQKAGSKTISSDLQQCSQAPYLTECDVHFAPTLKIKLSKSLIHIIVPLSGYEEKKQLYRGTGTLKITQITNFIYGSCCGPDPTY
jgi:hypothetical protein